MADITLTIIAKMVANECGEIVSVSLSYSDFTALLERAMKAAELEEKLNDLIDNPKSKGWGGKKLKISGMNNTPPGLRWP